MLDEPTVSEIRCEKQFYYLEFAVNFFWWPHRALYVLLQYIVLLSRVQVELDFSFSIQMKYNCTCNITCTNNHLMSVRISCILSGLNCLSGCVSISAYKPIKHPRCTEAFKT